MIRNLLGQSADNVVAAGALLVQTMGDFSHLSQHAERMRELEHHGDFLTHQMMNQLQQSFLGRRTAPRWTSPPRRCDLRQ